MRRLACVARDPEANDPATYRARFRVLYTDLHTTRPRIEFVGQVTAKYASEQRNCLPGAVHAAEPATRTP
jgi:hypothetical protein